MSAPPEEQPDPKRIVALLAKEFQEPIDDVALLYEQAHAELGIGAHVTAFLHVFATRKVQEILRKRELEKLALLVAGHARHPVKRLPMPPPLTCTAAPVVVSAVVQAPLRP